MHDDVSCLWFLSRIENYDDVSNIVLSDHLSIMTQVSNLPLGVCLYMPSVWLMISSQLLVVLLIVSLGGDLVGDQFYDGCGGRNVLSLGHCVHYALLERL